VLRGAGAPQGRTRHGRTRYESWKHGDEHGHGYDGERREPDLEPKLIEQPARTRRHDSGTGKALYINQTNSGAGYPLFIDNAGTRGVVVNVDGVIGGTNAGGAVFINPSSAATGVALQVYDQSSGRDNDLVRSWCTDPGATAPLLRLYNLGTSGSSASIRVDDPNPDIELLAFGYDWANGYGKFEIAVPAPGTPTKSSTITAAIDSSALSVEVVSASGWPATPFKAWIDGEEVNVSSIAGSVFTISRHQDGTSAAAHASGSTIKTAETAPDVLQLNGRRSSNDQFDVSVLVQRPDAGGRVGIGFQNPTNPYTLSGRLHISLSSTSPGGSSETAIPAIVVDTTSSHSANLLDLKRNGTTVLKSNQYGLLDATSEGLATKVKTGNPVSAISDADFSSTPPVGTMAVTYDTGSGASKLYVKVASGTWKSTTLT